MLILAVNIATNKLPVSGLFRGYLNCVKYKYRHQLNLLYVFFSLSLVTLGTKVSVDMKNTRLLIRQILRNISMYLLLWSSSSWRMQVSMLTLV